MPDKSAIFVYDFEKCVYKIIQLGLKIKDA